MKQIPFPPDLVYRSVNVYSRIKQKKISNEFLQIEEAVVTILKTVYNLEIPVNVYDPGLIYKVDTDKERNVRIDVTLITPSCPAADLILEDVHMKVEAVDGANNVEVNFAFEPEWDKDIMMEEAKLELGSL